MAPTTLALWLLIAAGVFSGFLAWHRRRALAELIKAVDSLDRRRAVRPIQPRVGGLTGRLAKAVNEVAPRLEARLEQLEGDRQQLPAVLGGMAESVIAVDSRRRLVFANEAAVSLFGLSSGSVGRLVAEIIRSPQVQQAVDATLGGHRAFRGEIVTPGPEAWPRGAGRCLAVQGTALPGTPPPGAVLVFHDVTDLRRLERMRQDFVANASHELKTPLSAIKAYAETLLDWAIDDPDVNRRFLHRIDEQADRLNLLIQDMLSLARLESGAIQPRFEQLRPARILRDCAERHRDRALAKNLAFEIAIDAAGEEADVLADSEALRQILDNLIDNAIKYTPPGGKVKVLCRRERDRVRLAVADTGIGIPRDELPRVFERFYRVDRARSRELGGTGLGLAIVKHQAQAIGGKVTVESRVGHGSTFSITLPVRDAAGADNAGPVPETADPSTIPS